MKFSQLNSKIILNDNEFHYKELKQNFSHKSHRYLTATTIRTIVEKWFPNNTLLT